MSNGQKRSAIRLEVLQEVVGKVSDNTEVRGSVMDISDGGLSLRSDSPIAVGETLRLTLPGLDGKPGITVDCEVRWNTWLEKQSVWQVGCVFRFEHNIDKARIVKYVQRLHSSRVSKFLLG